jgi:hypothetical protein
MMIINSARLSSSIAQVESLASGGKERKCFAMELGGIFW